VLRVTGQQGSRILGSRGEIVKPRCMPRVFARAEGLLKNVPPTNDHELESLLDIVRQAAEVVMRHYRGPIAVELKGPADPVTAADREANELVCGLLERRFPGAAILAEESVPSDPAEIVRRAQSARVFYVDPLDGTREFAEHRPEFAVMVGLAEHGRAALGVIALPAEGMFLAARVGGHAFRERPDGAREPLAVSAAATLARARLVVSRSRPPKISQAMMVQLGQATVLRRGSVGVKVGLLATADAELYVHEGTGLKAWDYCAPEAVLSAAGGRLTDLGGQPIEYRAAELSLHRGLLGSNGGLHADALAALA
jgi:3'(2'), 5'-bisphosphate nucleotidase